MKNKIFEDLFYGETGFGTFKAADNEKEFINKIEKAEKKLLEIINDEQKKIYEELDKIRNELHFEQELYAFSEGLKLGLKIGLVIND